ESPFQGESYHARFALHIGHYGDIAPVGAPEDHIGTEAFTLIRGNAHCAAGDILHELAHHVVVVAVLYCTVILQYQACWTGHMRPIIRLPVFIEHQHPCIVGARPMTQNLDNLDGARSSKYGPFGKEDVL